MTTGRFAVLIALAFAVYFAAYACVMRPLTDGEIERLVQTKTDLLARVPGKRLVVLAGSNGRFSHSCAAMQPIVHRPCVNASLLAGLGPDYVLSRFLPLLHPGDLVYMPFEYEEYHLDKADAFSGPDNGILWHRDKKLLASLGPERFARAALYADEGYFIRGILEMALKAKGIKRRFDEASINAFGDQIGHTHSVGAPYAQFLREKRVTIPELTLDSHIPFSARIVGDFLDQARRAGVTVVGGLPTTFNDVAIPPSDIPQLSAFYQAHGQQFMTLRNDSQYPRDCFFDKPYHLDQECQQVHSVAVAHALQTILTGDAAHE